MQSPVVLDQHARPPPTLRDLYKKLQKLDAKALERDATLIDLTRANNEKNSILEALESSTVWKGGQLFFDDDLSESSSYGQDSPVFEVKAIPGLFLIPNIIPPSTQVSLLDRLFHRDLADDKHKTNVHMHYHITYPSASPSNSSLSFFNQAELDRSFQPKEPDIHSTISIEQFLRKKLRWITLGGQYDWTRKVYPDEQPPAFPTDIKQLIEDAFPLKAEAAIVNLYSPGDTLSLHRDVSEACDQPLLSMSIGCDGIFVVGLGEDDVSVGVAIRLRSGDAVLMTGKSRYAWHGVPKVLGDTCPRVLEEWPGGTSRKPCQAELWDGWMRNKRININVRQMSD